MTEDEYEILPHKLLADLKYDVEALKKKLTEPETKTNELILEIESLKDSIHELNVIFEKALEETKEEDLSKLIHTLNEKMEMISNQNETIARGMVAIADKLEDFIERRSGTKASAPAQHSMGLPPQATQGRVAPRPSMSMETSTFGPSDNMDLPPPPPKYGSSSKKVRSGLFK